MTTEELQIIVRMRADDRFDSITAEQLYAIVDLISGCVFAHHVDWCSHVYADGDEPQYSEPSRHNR